MTQPASNAPADGAEDLAILYPERQQTIAGVLVTMREYGFVEGMKLHAQITPIADGMKAIALSGDLADPDALRGVFAMHADALTELIAVACDQPVEWVTSLGDADGRELQQLWWAVNCHFFGRRVRDSVLADRLKASAGLTSTPPSRAPTMTPNA